MSSTFAHEKERKIVENEPVFPKIFRKLGVDPTILRKSCQIDLNHTDSCTISIDYHVIPEDVLKVSHKSRPKIWDILENFQKICHQRGWKTSQENIVKVNAEYHNLIGTRTTHPSTFKKITSDKKVVIPDGRSYRVVGSDYTAWIFEQQPAKQLVETLTVEPELAKKTAIYDLSKFYSGKPLCMRMNKTRSPVFKEFEHFLQKSYRITMKPFYEPDILESKTFKDKLQKASQG